MAVMQSHPPSEADARAIKTGGLIHCLDLRYEKSSENPNYFCERSCHWIKITMSNNDKRFPMVHLVILIDWNCIDACVLIYVHICVSVCSQCTVVFVSWFVWNFRHSYLDIPYVNLAYQKRLHWTMIDVRTPNMAPPRSLPAVAL